MKTSVIIKRRLSAPVVTPQALAWDGKQLWMSSRDLGFLYKVRAGLASTVSSAGVGAMEIVDELDPPGIVWAGVLTNDGWRFTIGKGLNDDRYVYRYDGNGRFEKLFACPDLAGSYLSFDGANLYLSQWYEKRILKFDEKGNIIRMIDIGAEICGHTFVDGIIYVLRGQEKPNEDWRIARLDPSQEIPEIKDLAVVPFACRSLTFDGENFWTNYREKDTIVSFARPE